MAIAAFKCLKCTGTVTSGVHAAETDSNKNPCFLSADLHSSSTGSYPLRAPNSPVDLPVWSYEMWLRWELTAAPDTYIQNFAVYGPPTQIDYNNPPGSANKLFVYWGTASGAVTPTIASSVIATGLQSELYNSAGTARSVIISGSPARLTSVGQKTQYLVAQLKLTYGAKQGPIPTQMWSITYEET